jgi:hypothetical protein
VNEFGSSSSNPLQGDWVGFPDVDALEAGIQKDAGQCNEVLHNVGHHNEDKMMQNKLRRIALCRIKYRKTTLQRTTRCRTIHARAYN